MIESLVKISQIGPYLASSFERIGFVSAYSSGKRVAVYENKINEELNLKAFEIYCINSLGEESIEKEDIIVDYGSKGFLSFHQISPENWLIIVADKQLFPTVKSVVKKINKEKILFDLEDAEIQTPPETKVERIVESKEGIEEKLMSTQRLQQSILPDLSVLGVYFNKYFSYYSPEDVLSGDIYWLKETEESIFVVVADCKGNSMEGALATMTVHLILDQITVADPVSSLRSIYEDLAKSNSLNDASYSVSVEMAMCKFDKKTGRIEIATSGVPVLYIEGDDNSNLLKIKGAQNTDASNAKLESIKLYANKGDKLILYTDGLTNQSDKEGKSKLGNTGIRKMFMSMNGSFSGTLFENKFSEWKGNTKQRGDITVLALEI
ncbi:Serine phosphatase RsbU, regulator of sigma subunit [Reichenbachiella faecimaris]|uniref:Serine phosphatase RsbU, regulator of sigma subunit n=1 Tax=Reichenbachiella faecimaris TaxID=692418 RepID=A0A1W2GR37_REIFA|nr:SpoIIE family protein phosphatase [Reichenbachiella faecimaris]SMD38882.1 Serine phosphatase RsbU, regulator of sigma subunit [Reichenbachiella faecimaris]